MLNIQRFSLNQLLGLNFTFNTIRLLLDELQTSKQLFQLICPVCSRVCCVTNFSLASPSSLRRALKWIRAADSAFPSGCSDSSLMQSIQIPVTNQKKGYKMSLKSNTVKRGSMPFKIFTYCTEVSTLYPFNCFKKSLNTRIR